eukprot:1319939-Pyramimonas_sp.AAC.1
MIALARRPGPFRYYFHKLHRAVQGARPTAPMGAFACNSSPMPAHPSHESCPTQSSTYSPRKCVRT